MIKKFVKSHLVLLIILGGITITAVSALGTSITYVSPFQLVDNSTSTRLYISNSGNVGIGTTSPMSRLDIQNAGSVAGININGTNNQLEISDSATGGDRWYMYQAGGDKKLRFYQNSAARDRLVIDGAGNVGIGNNKFTETLNVNGTAAINGQVGELALRSQYNNNNASWIEYGVDRTGHCCNNFMLSQVPAGSGFGFAEGTTSNMIISPTGNVGIGTDTSVWPGSKLTVSSGDVYVAQQGKGVILRDTDGGGCHRLTINTAGTISATSITCPTG